MAFGALKSFRPSLQSPRVITVLVITTLGISATTAGLSVSDAAKLAKLRSAHIEQSENYAHLRGSLCNIHDNLRYLEWRLHPLEREQQLREIRQTMEQERERKGQQRVGQDRLESDKNDGNVVQGKAHVNDA
jgi:hypothetical protein